MDYLEIITSDAYSLRLKGLYLIISALGRISFSEVNIYTSEDEETLYDLLDTLINEGLITCKDGYCEKC